MSAGLCAAARARVSSAAARVRRALIGDDAVERERATRAHVASLEDRARGAEGAQGAEGDALARAVDVLSMLAPSDGGGVLAPDASRDLEVDGALLDAVCRTRLRGGRALVGALLARPLSDVVALRARQAALGRLEAVAAAAAPAVEARLDVLVRHEADAEWLWRVGGARSDDPERALCDIAFFRTWGVRRLNASRAALAAWTVHRAAVAPFVALFSPFAYVLVPVLVLRWRLGVRVPLRALLHAMWRSAMLAVEATLSTGRAGAAGVASLALSVLLYVQGALGALEVAGTLRRVCRILSARVEGAARFLQAARALQADLGLALPPDASWADAAAAACAAPTGATWGAGALRAFLAFDPAAHAEAVRRAYALDALLGVVRWRRETGACWAEFIAGPAGPHLRLAGVWHPVLGPRASRGNDWVLGAGARGGARHAVLTGPNAGGKSTLLRAVLSAVLLAQTLTVAPCTRRCRITAFSHIATHLNVPDVLGRESLFEAEMRRAKADLDALDALRPGGRALVVLDEVFSSTEPLEGVAGAMAVARRIAAHPGALCIISTHFAQLCSLEEDGRRRALPRRPPGFRNFRMTVDASGAPYRLGRGASRRCVALELMRARGFGDALVEDALSIKRELAMLRHAHAGAAGDGRRDATL